VLDNKPFIVTPLMENGNARIYIRKHPDCDRLVMVGSTSLVFVRQVVETQRPAISHISGFGVSSFTKCRAR
jgi:hypothetical protein